MRRARGGYPSAPAHHDVDADDVIALSEGEDNGEDHSISGGDVAREAQRAAASAQSRAAKIADRQPAPRVPALALQKPPADGDRAAKLRLFRERKHASDAIADAWDALQNDDHDGDVVAATRAPTASAPSAPQPPPPASAGAFIGRQTPLSPSEGVSVCATPVPPASAAAVPASSTAHLHTPPNSREVSIGNNSHQRNGSVPSLPHLSPTFGTEIDLVRMAAFQEATHNHARERSAVVQLEECDRLLLGAEAEAAFTTIVMRFARAAVVCTVRLDRQVAELTKRVAAAECELRAERRAVEMMGRQKRDAEHICSVDLQELKEQLARQSETTSEIKRALQAQFEASLAKIKDSYEGEGQALRAQVEALTEQLAARDKSRERLVADADRMALEPAPVHVGRAVNSLSPIRRDGGGGGGGGGGRSASPTAIDGHDHHHSPPASDGLSEFQLVEVAHQPRRGYLYMALPGKKWRKMFCALVAGTYFVAESDQSALRPLFHMAQVTKVRGSSAKFSNSFAFCFIVEFKASPRSRVELCEFACPDKHERHIWMETLKESPQVVAARSAVGAGDASAADTASLRSAWTATSLAASSRQAALHNQRAAAHGGAMPLGYLGGGGGGPAGFSEAAMAKWKGEQEERRQRLELADVVHQDIESRLGGPKHRGPPSVRFKN